MMISFFIPGLIPPKGSTVAFRNKWTGQTIVRQQGADKIADWKARAELSAKMAGATITDSAVSVRLTFLFPRPKGHHKKDGTLKPGAPLHKTTRPDCDKLIRCALDALTGIVVRDDSQVVEIHAEKSYAPEPGMVGTQISVFGKTGGST